MAKSQTAQTSGVTFQYWEHGPADGLPVLLLHGFPYAANSWDDVIEELQPKRRKLRLFVLSMRGYGETLVTQENLLSGQEAALTQDVFAFADALGLERFVILGHDWGARAGFDASVIAPERVLGHLALASPYVMYDGRDLPPAQAHSYWYQWYFQTAQGEKALRTNATDLCEQIWHTWSPHWRFSRRELEQTAAYWKNPQFATLVLDSYRHRWGNSLGKPAYNDLQNRLEAKPKAKIAVPTLYGYGLDDHCVLPAAGAEQKKYFSGWYDSVGLKGVGHHIPKENPQAVAKLFQTLLKKVKV